MRPSSNPFSPYGRSPRRLALPAFAALALLAWAVDATMPGYPASMAAVSFTLTSMILWPAYCVLVKRLHDADRTSVAALVNLAVYVVATFIRRTAHAMPFRQEIADDLSSGMLAMAILGSIAIMALRPISGPNRYGPDPTREQEEG